MPTITRKELIERIAEQTKTPQAIVREIFQKFLDEVINELGQGNRLEFRDFGVFEPRSRKKRVGAEPQDAGAARSTCQATRQVQAWAADEASAPWRRISSHPNRSRHLSLRSTPLSWEPSQRQPKSIRRDSCRVSSPEAAPCRRPPTPPISWVHPRPPLTPMDTV